MESVFCESVIIFSFLVSQFFVYLYLIALDFPPSDNPMSDFPISGYLTWRDVVRRLGLLVNGVFNGGHFAFLVAPLPPFDIPGFFKLPYSSADCVDTFPVDL